VDEHLGACERCGATLSPGLVLCGACATPRDTVPMWAGPLMMGRPQVDPNPVPPPVYSRWEAGPTTFGPRTKFAITVVVVFLVLSIGGIFLLGGPMVFVWPPVMIVGAWRFLRDVWRSDRVK